MAELMTRGDSDTAIRIIQALPLYDAAADQRLLESKKTYLAVLKMDVAALGAAAANDPAAS
ncbi:MAG TPA: hypothetical protein VNA86_02495 [bacterium]|nr:hypothetical protein [bacterium]